MKRIKNRRIFWLILVAYVAIDATISTFFLAWWIR